MKKLNILCIILVSLFFLACKSNEIIIEKPVEVRTTVEVHDTTVVNKVDSFINNVYIKDSSFIENLQFYYDSLLNVNVLKITNTHIREKNTVTKNASIKDSIKTVEIHDTIEKPVIQYITKKETVEVNKLTWYQSFLLAIGVMTILSLLICAGFKYAKQLLVKK